MNGDKVRMGVASDVAAKDLARMISEEHGQKFKISCCGVWTEHRGAPAIPLEIDIGGGFVPAVRITGDCHTTVLVGPFAVNSRPSHLMSLTLFCDNYFILREPN